MKKKIILKRVFHRDKWRILISFNYDESITGIVKQIEGSRYSDSYKAWYVDDDEETLKQILLVLRDKADIDISALTRNRLAATENVETPYLGVSTETPDSHNVLTKIKTEKKAPEPEFTDTEEELIPTSRIVEKVVERERFSPVEFRINEQDGRLAIRFTGHFDGAWVEEIKSFGQYYYDKISKDFLLPWSVSTGDSLSDYFASRGVEVIIIKSVPAEALKNARREMGDEIRSRSLGEKALEGLDTMSRYLDEVRYSDRTNESYLALLELFFKYFNDKDPYTISMDEVSAFVYEFIVTNGY